MSVILKLILDILELHIKSKKSQGVIRKKSLGNPYLDFSYVSILYLTCHQKLFLKLNQIVFTFCMPDIIF